MKPTAPRKDGPITKALKEAMTLRAGLIADGTPEHEADYIVGQGLKAILANPRPEGWRFYCPSCKDTGWINVDPSPDELARLTAMYGEKPQYAGYLAKCDPCKWTQMEREKRRQVAGQGDDDDFVTAGITKRPSRKFSKFGQ